MRSFARKANGTSYCPRPVPKRGRGLDDRSKTKIKLGMFETISKAGTTDGVVVHCVCPNQHVDTNIRIIILDFSLL